MNGAGLELDYAERLARFKDASLGLWDVLAAGQREGSLDSAIVRTTAVVNDFVSLFERYRGIERVCFNGRTAEQLYRRRVLPNLPARFADIPLHALPSTSPAHAGMTHAAKLDRWSVLLPYLPAAQTRAPAATADRAARSNSCMMHGIPLSKPRSGSRRRAA